VVTLIPFLSPRGFPSLSMVAVQKHHGRNLLRSNVFKDVIITSLTVTKDKEIHGKNTYEEGPAESLPSTKSTL